MDVRCGASPIFMAPSPEQMLESRATCASSNTVYKSYEGAHEGTTWCAAPEGREATKYVLASDQPHPLGGQVTVTVAVGGTTVSVRT